MNKIFKLLIMIVLPINILAHSLLLNVFDNEDNTITVEGIFNTGESAAGALIILEALNSGEILFKQRLLDDSELTIKIPKEPYKIILDGGEGHTIVKDGIAPLNGFIKKETKETKEVKEVKKKQKNENPRFSILPSSSMAVNVSIIIAFILLILTILISIRNTNKIISEIKSNSRYI